MHNDEQFVTEVLDRMHSVGPVEAKKMFGGHGIFADGRMLALVADNELYLKVDEQTVEHFEELGLPPFRYTQSGGRVVTMSYRLAPESFFEDEHSATTWTGLARQAAARAPVKTARRK